MGGQESQSTQKVKGQKGLMCAVKPHMGRPNGNFFEAGRSAILVLFCSQAPGRGGVFSTAGGQRP